jgi:hypothetical protein
MCGMKRPLNPKLLTAIAAVFALPSTEEQIAAACALSAPEVHPDLVNLFHRRDADPRKTMPRKSCMLEGGWEESTQYNKEKTRSLRTLLDGSRRLVVTSSFYEDLITRLMLSNPIDSPAPKGTATSTRFTAAKGGSRVSQPP